MSKLRKNVKIPISKNPIKKTNTVDILEKCMNDFEIYKNDFDLTEINKKDAIYHYTETHDHSKIALSIDPDNPWIFVGDLNRMTSQLTRGGGGFVIIDDKLWNNLNKFIF